jgi:hypothetical protein
MAIWPFFSMNQRIFQFILKTIEFKKYKPYCPKACWIFIITNR